ncbi:hypothetical protein [Kitasatospora sp. GP82]|uniref:hypothetical protein n=1 Tax=Kitasatospora sp. GP82 TaxID=3035089 RepID=UPI002475D378|nr:hypothetical protein [Kitasatospora sp. GP82]MDH6130006.1 hypothetical protein [Kitasatospora sp. GP82]
MNSAPIERTTGMRFYAQSPVDSRWLSRVMVPVVRSLRDDHGASVAYLGRGWKHGPHVELVAYGPRTIPWAEVAEGLDWRTEELGAPLTDRDYLAQARELGRLEKVAPPYLPLHPRGTVEFLADDPNPGWPPALRALRDSALTRMFEPMARTLEPVPAGAGGVSVTALAEAFVALCTAHPRGAAYGVFSLRSHAEAFLHWAGAAKDPRPSFQRRLAKDADVFRALVERVRDGGESAEAAAWRSAFAYCMGSFDAAVAAGDLSPELLDRLAPVGERAGMGPPGVAERASSGRSDFHEAVAASKVSEQPPGWFASYRLLINLFYSRLPLLGVTPIQRFYLCFAIAETVDEVYGESWRTRLERVAVRSRA